MPRGVFVFTEPPQHGRLVITGDEADHLRKVLRIKSGYEITGFDGEGNGWYAVIESFDKKAVIAKVVTELPHEQEEQPKITVAVGAVKRAHMEWAVEKAAEIGASGLIPLLTKFAVVNPGEGKIDRWRTISIAAAKQSQRLRLMDVMEPITFQDLLKDYSKKAILWFCHVSENGLSFGTLFQQVGEIRSKEQILIIGPEGGWADEEVALAKKHNAHIVSLGDHPLRTETAVASALSIFKALTLNFLK